MERSCDTCRFYQAYRNHAHGGLCRIDPPGRYATKGQYVGGWPVRGADDWCGQHEERRDG